MAVWAKWTGHGDGEYDDRRDEGTTRCDQWCSCYDAEATLTRQIVVPSSEEDQRSP